MNIKALQTSLLITAICLGHPENPKGRYHSELGMGFASSLALYDSVLVVGETASGVVPGAVYIFVLDPDSSNWVLDTLLTASDGVAGDGFGRSVALRNNTLFVGKFNASDDGCYVFQRDESGSWDEVQVLTTGFSGSDFGYRVALGNEIALVTARKAVGSAGRAYVYTLNSSGSWEPTGTLSGSQVEGGDQFGKSVDIYGNYAIIGTNTGESAYIFERDSSTGSWSEMAELTHSSGTGRLGYAVAIGENIALVGRVTGNNGRGQVVAYEYYPTTGTVNQVGTLSASDESSSEFFGVAISIDGDEALIGKYNGTKAYLFQRGSSGSWQEIETMTGDDTEGSHRFGRSVSLDGPVSLVGAYYNEAAYVFSESPSTGNWSQMKKLTAESRAGAITGEEKLCTDGKAGPFPCDDVNLLAFLPPKDIGGGVGTELNDIWGWTDSVTQKEWALVGLTDGTSFVDISDPINPKYVGKLPTETYSSSWRDMKVYQDHVFVVADNVGSHGLQVFDLTKLRNLPDSVVTFQEDAHLSTFGSAHNIFINEETGYAYVVGADQPCEGYLIVDISNPANPQYETCYADYNTGNDGGYTHDVQCVVYNGPDTEHVGKEICLGCNEDALSIVDVTNKNNIAPISVGNYNSFYTHQGWLTEDHRYFIQDDELDEYSGNTYFTKTIIWDLVDLDNPVVLEEYIGQSTSIDHNLYIVGDRVYQANYTSGLRILDITDISNPEQIGFFDTYPGDNIPKFDGAWGNYPFFESGIVIVSSMEEGLFVLKPNPAATAAVEDDLLMPARFSVAQNFPNPFNPATTIMYSVPYESRIKIKVLDLSGRYVSTLFNDFQTAGWKSVTWNGLDWKGQPVGSGVFLYVLEAENFRDSKKMILLR